MFDDAVFDSENNISFCVTACYKYGRHLACSWKWANIEDVWNDIYNAVNAWGS